MKKAVLFFPALMGLLAWTAMPTAKNTFRVETLSLTNEQKIFVASAEMTAWVDNHGNYYSNIGGNNYVDNNGNYYNNIGGGNYVDNNGNYYNNIGANNYVDNNGNYYANAFGSDRPDFFSYLMPNRRQALPQPKIALAAK